MELDLIECLARCEWASRHLGRLREAITTYEQSDPYAIRHDFDSVAYTSSVYLAPKSVPLEISFIAGDVVHSLHSALDHFAWQLALAIDPRAPTFPLEDRPDGASWRWLFFPLRSKADDSDNWLPERLRGRATTSRHSSETFSPSPRQTIPGMPRSGNCRNSRRRTSTAFPSSPCPRCTRSTR
jgi:hypothetical protein